MTGLGWFTYFRNSVYPEACICKSHSPITAFSVNFKGDILVSRLPCSFVLYHNWFTVWSEKRSMGCGLFWNWKGADSIQEPSFCTYTRSPVVCHMLFSFIENPVCALMTTLRRETGQVLASFVKWKARPSNS